MRTAVITGAARGIGRAIAERLTADGFSLVLVDADGGALETTAVALGGRAAALDVTDDTAVDTLSKAALETLTRIAAVEFGPQGVRCNAVGPGIVPTEGTLAHYGDDETRNRRSRTLPVPRFGTPDDIADVVSFFSGEQSRYVTGRVGYVDGRYTCAGAEFFRAARDATHDVAA